jgi:nicotinamidase-related amidase
MTNPQTRFTRDRPIPPGRAALLVIDVQNATCGPKQKAEKPEFYLAATLRVIPNISRLLAAFRSGLEVFLRYRRFNEDQPLAQQPRSGKFRQLHVARRGSGIFAG